MKKLFIFDMDGVILDSMPYLKGMGVEMMLAHYTKYNISREQAEEFYDKTVGLPFIQQLNEIFSKPVFDESNRIVADLYSAAHTAMAPLFPLSPMAEKVLATAKQDGILLGLVSSTARSICVKTQAANLPFHYFAGYDPEMPKSIQIKHILSESWTHPGEAIYFGDTYHDKKLAQEIRTNFVHILSPQHFAIKVGIAMNRGDNDGSLAPV